MLTIRTRIFIGFSIGVLILLAVSLILLTIWKSKKADDKEKELDPIEFVGDVSPGVVPQNISPTKIPKGIEIKPLTTEEIEKNAAKQASKIFIERYASYSTDNAYQNIRDVEGLVNDSLWNRLELQIKDADTGNAEFVGLTTKVFVVEMNEWGGDNASFSLKVLKTENKDGVISNYQDAYYVEVVKEGEKWLVIDFGKE